MYAVWRSCGPSLSLNSRDRPNLDKGKTVYGERKAQRGDTYVRVSLSVLKRPYVRDCDRFEDMMLEEGWKVRTVPPHPRRKAAAEHGRYLPMREFRLSISPEHWEKLKKEGYILRKDGTELGTLTI